MVHLFLQLQQIYNKLLLKIKVLTIPLHAASALKQQIFMWMTFSSAQFLCHFVATRCHTAHGQRGFKLKIMVIKSPQPTRARSMSDDNCATLLHFKVIVLISEVASIIRIHKGSLGCDGLHLKPQFIDQGTASLSNRVLKIQCLIKVVQRLSKANRFILGSAFKVCKNLLSPSS